MSQLKNFYGLLYQSLDYRWLDYDCMSYSQNTTETKDMMYDINL